VDHCQYRLGKFARLCQPQMPSSVTGLWHPIDHFREQYVRDAVIALLALRHMRVKRFNYRKGFGEQIYHGRCVIPVCPLYLLFRNHRSYIP